MVTEATPSLTWQDCEGVFRELFSKGETPIVVGGQAINVWLNYYASDVAAFAAPVASKDIDVIGDRETARACSTILGAQLHLVHRAKGAVPINAVVTLGEAENALRIDFQDGAAPNEITELRDAAVELPTDWGFIRVMHPLHCLKTRVHNVLEIWHGGERKYANPHGRAQMRAAMVIFRAFARELASKERGPGKVLKSYEALFEYARSRAGESLLLQEGINLLDCIEPLPELPEKFRTERFPRMSAQLARE